MSRSVAEIIQDHGVPTVAAAADVPERNVRMWKFRNRIPPEHWRALSEKQIASLEELADMAASQDGAAA